MRWVSGWCFAMALPRCSSRVVLPALGGETMSPRWPRPMGAIRSITRKAHLGRVLGEVERFVGADRDQVLEVGELLVLLRAHPPRFGDFDEYTATVPRVTAEALHLGPVAKAEVPCDHVRNDDVFAGREVVLSDLPYEPSSALRKFDNARHRHGRPGGRNRSLARVPEAPSVHSADGVRWARCDDGDDGGAASAAGRASWAARPPRCVHRLLRNRTIARVEGLRESRPLSTNRGVVRGTASMGASPGTRGRSVHLVARSPTQTEVG